VILSVVIFFFLFVAAVFVGIELFVALVLALMVLVSLLLTSLALINGPSDEALRKQLLIVEQQLENMARVAEWLSSTAKAVPPSSPPAPAEEVYPDGAALMPTVASPTPVSPPLLALSPIDDISSRPDHIKDGPAHSWEATVNGFLSSILILAALLTVGGFVILCMWIWYVVVG
jgi:hypothetical protein